MAKQTNSKPRFQNAQSGQSAGSKQSSQNAGNRQDVQAQGKQRPTSRAGQRATKQQQRQQELYFARRSRLITIFSILGAVVIGVVATVNVIFYDQSHPHTQTSV